MYLSLFFFLLCRLLFWIIICKTSASCLSIRGFRLTKSQTCQIPWYGHGNKLLFYFLDVNLRQLRCAPIPSCRHAPWVEGGAYQNGRGSFGWNMQSVHLLLYRSCAPAVVEVGVCTRLSLSPSSNVWSYFSCVLRISKTCRDQWTCTERLNAQRRQTGPADRNQTGGFGLLSEQQQQTLEQSHVSNRTARPQQPV